MSEFIEPRRREESFQTVGVILDFGEVTIESIGDGIKSFYHIGKALVAMTTDVLRLDRN
jgi:hypothetical protein